jgi:hypothetical protein
MYILKYMVKLQHACASPAARRASADIVRPAMDASVGVLGNPPSSLLCCGRSHGISSQDVSTFLKKQARASCVDGAILQHEANIPPLPGLYFLGAGHCSA